MASMDFHSQDYTPFPTDSTAWLIIPTVWDNNQEPSIWNPHYVYISGDTVIGNISYTKLYENSIPNFSTYPFKQFPLFSNEFIGFVKEVEKQVFLYPNGDLQDEVLLYDFGLNIGDTITWANLPNDPQEYAATLVGINSIQIFNGETRKTHSYDFVITYAIEGIGNIEIGGLLCPPCGFNDYVEEIMCVSTPNELIFSTSVWGEFFSNPVECLTATYVGIESNSRTSKLRLLPNPSSGTCYLTLYKEEPTNILIYNLQGRLAKKQQANTQEVQIELPEEQGVYLIQVIGETFSSVVKVVKE